MVKKVSDFSIILLSLIIVIINEPILSRIIGGAGIFLLMIMYLTVNIKSIGYNKYLVTNTVLIGSYLIFEILYEILGISSCDYIYYYYTISFMFFAVAVPPILGKITRRQQNILTTAVVFSLVIAMVSNIRLYAQYGSYYIRINDYYDDITTNVISTQYNSALVLFCGIIFTQIKYSQKHKVPLMLLCVFSIYFIIVVGQRMTAILLLFLMLMFMIIYSNKKTTWKYISYIVMAAAAVILVINYEAILIWFSSILNNERITKRINQLIYMLRMMEIQGAGGSLEIRFNLIMNSINTFARSVPSFIFGIGEHREDDLLIGHHSQWIDQAAKYGVIGCMLLFFTIKSCINNIKRIINVNKGDILYVPFVVIIAVFLIRGLLGYVIYPYFGIQLFVFMPIVFMRIKEENKLQYGGQI